MYSCGIDSEDPIFAGILKMTYVQPSVANRGFCSSPNVAAVVPTDDCAKKWMQGAPEGAKLMINANQMVSLGAMICFIATRSCQSEFRVERILSDHFHIPNAKCLPAALFDDAIRYLIDANVA
jgi:hypothetical protein